MGQILSDELVEAAASSASEKEMNPFGNIHTSPEFQKHLAHVLTRKALKQANQRAEGLLQ